jgi:hypothetical protein
LLGILNVVVFVGIATETEAFHSALFGEKPCETAPLMLVGTYCTIFFEVIG